MGEKKHPAASVQQFIDSHEHHRLLNCGLLGGKRELLIDFIGALLSAWAENVAEVRLKSSRSVGDSDMGLFNQVMLTQFAEKISNGRHVNTRFKAWESNDVSWWKHK